jgi:myo-inositol-1(or 4)-monophosphatase
MRNGKDLKQISTRVELEGQENMEKDERFLKTAIAAAKEAGRIQMRHFNRSHQIEYKGDIDFVTEVDTLCDRAIMEIIYGVFPDHDVLTEESPFKGKGSPWKWIIDPLDGTINYYHQYPCFCVSIGLEVEGEMILGVVYNPILDELFHAEKGKGAFLNKDRISVSSENRLDGSFLCTGFPYDVRENADFYLGYFREFITRSFAVRRPGSAAIDLCYVAAGRFDGFWEFNLRAWDMAAGSLIVTEAGGRVTDLKGQPFHIDGKEILASNGLIHQEMLEVLKKVNHQAVQT